MKRLHLVPIMILIAVAMLYNVSTAQDVTGYRIDEKGNTNVINGTVYESNTDMIFKWNERMGGDAKPAYDLYNTNRSTEYNSWEQTDDGLIHTHIEVTPYIDDWDRMERAMKAQVIIDNGLQPAIQAPLIKVEPVKVIDFNKLFTED